MRTDRSSGTTGPSDGSVSRRAFLLAGGCAVGTVVGTASAAAGDADHVVGATAPYLAAAREAAVSATASTSDAAVVPRPAGDLEAPPDLVVSGRPGSYREVHGLSDVLVDGRAALATPEGTWRDALQPTAVEERRAAEAPLEAWSEVDGTVPDVGNVERPDATEEVTTLVRGPRAYQYAHGRGGVGYYDVDASAIVATSGDSDGGSGGAVPVVRLAYVHARRESRSDGSLAAFLDAYGEPTAVTGDEGATFVDPAIRE